MELLESILEIFAIGSAVKHYTPIMCNRSATTVAALRASFTWIDALDGIKSAHRRCCKACPMSRIALQLAPRAIQVLIKSKPVSPKETVRFSRPFNDVSGKRDPAQGRCRLAVRRIWF